MYRDIAKLITVDYETNGDGYEVPTSETAAEVYCNVKSVARSEFYKSLQSGIKMAIAFDMRCADYDGQTTIEYDGKRYSVERTYSSDGEIIELNCSDKAV